MGVRLLGLPSPSDMLHRCICWVFLNYLRHVSLDQNLFTVVATGSAMPLHFCCVSLTLYYDVIPMVNIVTITPVPCSVPGDGMCQGSAIITSRSMQ